MIERDYGNGNKQVAYEYGYNSDGGKVWKRDYLNPQEYRYLCRIGCGGTPMRVYNRAINDTIFNSQNPILDGTSFTIHLNVHPIIILRHTNTMNIMSLSDNQNHFIIIKDVFSVPTGAVPPTTIEPSILLPPPDMPYYFTPTFPKPLPSSLRSGHLLRIPLPVGIIGGGDIIIPPSPPVPKPPSNPPLPHPEPPSNPLPPPGAPVSPGGSACEQLKECQKGGGDCTDDCMSCCDSFCGPVNYPKCYNKCSASNGYFTPRNPITDCGVMIVDKPKPPENEEDIGAWIVLFCELLKAWDLIPEWQMCNEPVPL